MGGKLSPNIDLDLDADIDGNMDLDVRLPTDYSFRIREFPPLDITVQPMDITVQPMDVSLRLKEIPSVRAHLPINYKIGFSFLGRELACVHLCGQGQAITEPYQPYPCEPQPAKYPGREAVTARPKKAVG